MPLVNRTFDQLINFTRTTAATFVGSNGLIQTTPQSRNLLTFTEEFDNAAWGKTAATVAANTATAPDGTSTADTILATAAASGAPRMQQSPSTVAGQPYTLSAYFKANGTNFAFLSLRTAANDWAGAEFNLATGVVSRNASSGTVTYNGATITAVGDGWYRCAVTITPAAVSQFIFVGSSNGSGAFSSGYPNFTNAGTETVFIWGAQLEQASAATGYTRNFGGLFPPRFDYDPVTLAPRGLLIEEQRTNLLLRSAEFDNASWSKLRATVTANSTTSPDGTANAEKLVEDTSTDTHLILQAPTVVASTTYSYSVFLKAAERTRARLQDGGGSSAIGNFDLSNGTVISASNATATITNVGDGWYRCTITFTTVVAQTTASCRILLIDTGTNTSYTGDGTSGIFLWGAQLEAGAFATSYIPTVASQVTRTADVATIAAPNFASWYNQSEGTFVAEYDTVAPVLRYAVYASDGTSNNLIGIEFSSGGQVRGRITTAGVSQASMGAGAAISANAVVNAGIAYATNSAITASEGTLSLEDTSVTLPTLNQLSIGASLVSTFLNGHIRSIRYYPTRLSNAQLQALTA